MFLLTVLMSPFAYENADLMPFYACVYFKTLSLSAEFDRTTVQEETLDPAQLGMISAEISANSLISFHEPSGILT